MSNSSRITLVFWRQAGTVLIRVAHCYPTRGAKMERVTQKRFMFAIVGGEACVVGRKRGVRTKIAIPSTVLVRGKTYPVTEIGPGAFQGSKLTSVIIPDSVRYIGSGAFHGNRLTSVTIGNSVTIIGTCAFTSNDLTSVIIPDSVRHIGEGAFSNNNLTSVTIGNSVRHIHSCAFMGNNLTSVTIPNSVTSIGSMAFYQNNLTSVTIPDSVASVGHAAFAIARSGATSPLLRILVSRSHTPATERSETT